MDSGSDNNNNNDNNKVTNFNYAYKFSGKHNGVCQTLLTESPSVLITLIK